MAKRLKAFQRHLKNMHDLVTTPQNTRAGFIALALERGRRATPYVAEGRDLKINASTATNPLALRDMKEIQAALLTAAGVSDKAAGHFEQAERDIAIENLISEFLEPAGGAFVEELVYRFLLTRGDSLGGSMRNISGVLAQRKFARALMASLTNAGTSFRWLHGTTGVWANVPQSGSAGIELDLRGMTWPKRKDARTLYFNLRVPTVRNSVDVCLFDCSPDEDQTAAINNPARYLALGELKGGIDPAGADEHWKTAGTTLARIREAFRKQVLNPPIFYVGGAIVEKMASEIWEQLLDGRLANAANLTTDDQVASLCSWLCQL
ncbi:MAG: restriction endonuclease [Planctomycetes bacterium]|nr:restriction endonuclease [Planctomycetota bacterium]